MSDENEERMKFVTPGGEVAAIVALFCFKFSFPIIGSVRDICLLVRMHLVFPRPRRVHQGSRELCAKLAITPRIGISLLMEAKSRP